MINNGIISVGNNNVNVLKNENIYRELKILLKNIDKNTEDYDLIKEVVQKKDISKIKQILKQLSKKTLSLIKELNLGILENLIANFIIK